jgi:3-dehydroquinate dehydratase-2
MKQILVLNGPNLNLLGKREPGIYGARGFTDYFAELQGLFPQVVLEYFQSNHEGELIDKLHQVGFSYHGVVFNAGGYTHTSVALGDAVAAISIPVVEVHISNVHAREPFRYHSYLSKNCAGIIVGFGLEGYRLAIDFLTKRE